MVIFFTILGVSILGLVSLIAVKRFELATGRILLSNIRPATGYMLGRGLHFVERSAPALVRHGLTRLYAQVRTGLKSLVAWSVFHTERLLEQTLRTLRHTTAARGENEASKFLREVAEHKRSLLKKSAKAKKPNAIYEE